MAEKALELLEDTANMLEKTQINFKKSPKDRLTKGYIEARLESIEHYWDTIKTQHQEIIKHSPRGDRKKLPYFNNNQYFVYEDLYLNFKADLKDMLFTFAPNPTASTSTPTTPSSQPSQSQARLPGIQLPNFSGNYEDWPTFQDLFASLVDNDKSLSEVQKLHYLKTSLSGEAHTLLKHIQVTDRNYIQAWDILKNRFSNKRLIVQSILKKLFNQRKIMIPSAVHIKSLLDNTTECLNTLKNQDISTDSWDPLLIYMMVQKLDATTHKDWEEHSYNDHPEELPTWTQFKSFLESKFRTLELLAPQTSTILATNKDNKYIKERSYHATFEKKCTLCRESHTLSHCKEFVKMEPAQRSQYARDNHLCYNCLVPGHSSKNCRLQMLCRICHKRHHSLLHEHKDKADILGRNETQQPIVSGHLNLENKKTHTLQGTEEVALLATAMVQLRNEYGHTIVARALIDQGSQASFVSENIAQRLRLKRKSVKGSICGVGSTRTAIKHVVNVKVLSRWETDFSLPIQAYVMSKQLTTKIPTKTVISTLPHQLEGLNLADPTYCTPGSIDILLGVNEYARIVKPDLIKGTPGQPCAQNTNLGWILFGECNANAGQPSVVVMHANVEVEDMLKTMWEIETDTKRTLTNEEKLCEENYEKTHRRNKEGRYIVNLPFKYNKLQSPDGHTREIAIKRLQQLERKFDRNKQLKEDYTNVMKEYIELEHMKEIEEESKDKERCVYLPHHAVVRNDKETTKTRVVFDASCKGTNGVSLNNELLTGPILQEDLRYIIMRWRTHPVCFVADIEKMYRMILVDDKETDYQRIVWRDDISEPIKHYRLKTVTFGTASAPYLAIKTLMQIAKDEVCTNEVARIINEDFYVDDVMSGANTVQEAISNATELKEVLRRGGFELKKWASNNSSFLNSMLPSELSSKASMDLNMDGTIKALGVAWNTVTDKFQYKLTLDPIAEGHITKRLILSDIQKLFDPLGWIAPSIINTKILIQKLWMEGLDWDENISCTLQDEWTVIRNDLEHVDEIEIDRWIQTSKDDDETVEYHGFSDASIKAYAAVVYARVIKSDGTIAVHLIASRTRVAPLKTVTLPRLELCGAVLLSRLMTQIGHALRVPTRSMFAWTDSSIVLSWINGEPQRWRTFVANRVSEITGNVSRSRWYHVMSQHNPADVASRGMFVSDLRNCKLWWQGPEWLQQRYITFDRPIIVPTEEESREVKIINNLKIEESERSSSLEEQFENFDTLKELLKTITLCRQFIHSKKKPIESTQTLTTIEQEESSMKCIKIVQALEFEEEIQYLQIKTHVKRNSRISNLNAYLDNMNILRVGGRLRNVDIEEKTKHPIILGNKNNLTLLIIKDAHQQTLHGGVQLMLCYLRTKYWIIKAKSLVKLCIRKCIVCTRQNARTRTQLMGDLPKERVIQARPFIHSGVDFAGPLQILVSRGRGAKLHKAYIAIFVCMATKAVHLELVGDLTSESFIAAFRRFVARRGRCAHLWSDQGRNFIGANKELIAAWKEACLEFTGAMAESLAEDGTQWHFIPAYSPHFGGLWEAGVKSIKYHLKRILNTNLTYEEMTTVLTQVEACLNSRPLCPLDDTNVDIEALTPGHFLIGEAIVAVPGPSYQDLSMSHISRWQHLQKLVASFWQRWQAEYLTRLQQRQKWQKKEKELEVGEIVLIKEDNVPPGKWALGRVMEKHPGPDSLVRVYTIRSNSKLTKRPITKLCPLNILYDV